LTHVFRLFGFIHPIPCLFGFPFRNEFLRLRFLNSGQFSRQCPMNQHEPCEPIVAEEKSSEVNSVRVPFVFLAFCSLVLNLHEAHAHDDTRQSLSMLLGKKLLASQRKTINKKLQAVMIPETRPLTDRRLIIKYVEFIPLIQTHEVGIDYILTKAYNEHVVQKRFYFTVITRDARDIFDESYNSCAKGGHGGKNKK
jgi:hypothetical protein